MVATLRKLPGLCSVLASFGKLARPPLLLNMAENSGHLRTEHAALILNVCLLVNHAAWHDVGSTSGGTESTPRVVVAAIVICGDLYRARFKIQQASGSELELSKQISAEPRFVLDARVPRHDTQMVSCEAYHQPASKSNKGLNKHKQTETGI